MLVSIPKNIRSKKEIIEYYARILGFPCYYKMNWDSFEECLLDFLEENGESISIVHDGTRAGFPEEYLDIVTKIERENQILIAFKNQM